MRQLEYNFLGRRFLQVVAFALCGLAFAASSVHAAVRVALMDITSEDSAYRAEIAAADLTAALYGQLPRKKSIEWVERQQLEVAATELKLSALGRRTDSAALRVGKWVKADLLLLGRILAGANRTSGVRLEVIDLDRAETLVERVVGFSDDLTRSGSPPARQTGLVIGELDGLLQQAIAERERRRQQIAVAVLFFHPRVRRGMDIRWDEGMKHTAALIPRSLDQAFASAVTANQQLRLVRFPRPNRALEEAELVLSGLVESDAQAWLRVADYYVWGETTCTNVWLGQGAARQQQTSVGIAVHVWDGRSEPKTFRDGPIILDAGGLPEAEVAARCEKLAQRASPIEKPATALPSESVRQKISKVLEEHADNVLGDGFFAVFDSLENRARIGDLIQSLELACFFDPENQSAQWKLVSHRWGGTVAGYAKDKFRFAWRASEAWGKYANQTHSAPGLPEIRGAIASTFEELGRAGEHEKLFAMLEPPPAPTALAAPKVYSWIEKLRDNPKFTVPRIAALPPKLEVRLEKLNLPLGSSRDALHGYMPVHALWYSHGKLWIAASVEQEASLSQVNPDLARELTPARGNANRLWCYDPETKQVRPAPGGLTSSSALAVSATDAALWVAGEGVARLDFSSEKVRRFGVADGLPLRDTEAVAVVGDRLFAAGGRFELFVQDLQNEQWSPLKLPLARWSSGTGQPMKMRAAHGQLLFVANTAGLYAPSSGRWKLIPEVADVQSIDADGAGFWLGGRSGLHFLDAKTEKLVSWKSESGLSWPSTTFAIAPAPSMRVIDWARSARDPAWAHDEIVRAFKKFTEDRKAVHARREQAHITMETAPPKTRLRGSTTVLASDGDFLWVGSSDYYDYVLLLHKPSRAWVGHLVMPAEVTSLAVSDRYLWIGLSGGENRLLQINKQTLLATPRSRWVKDEIGVKEFAAAVAGLPKHDQALHAFFAGDYASAAKLLEGEAAQSLCLETLFLLAFSYDSLGLDKPDASRRYFGEIMAQYPDSPWAEEAAEFMKEDELRHQEKKVRALQLAKFDRNHDGVLDAFEKRAMAADPAYAQEAAKLTDQQMLRKN